MEALIQENTSYTMSTIESLLSSFEQTLSSPQSLEIQFDEIDSAGFQLLIAVEHFLSSKGFKLTITTTPYLKEQLSRYGLNAELIGI